MRKGANAEDLSQTAKNISPSIFFWTEPTEIGGSEIWKFQQ